MFSHPDMTVSQRHMFLFVKSLQLSFRYFKSHYSVFVFCKFGATFWLAKEKGLLEEEEY